MDMTQSPITDGWIEFACLELLLSHNGVDLQVGKCDHFRRHSKGDSDCWASLHSDSLWASVLWASFLIPLPLPSFRILTYIWWLIISGSTVVQSHPLNRQLACIPREILTSIHMLWHNIILDGCVWKYTSMYCIPIFANIHSFGFWIFFSCHMRRGLICSPSHEFFEHGIFFQPAFHDTACSCGATYFSPG